jgi:hypothetical protein
MPSIELSEIIKGERATIKKTASNGRKIITQQFSDIPERTFENTIPDSKKSLRSGTTLSQRKRIMSKVGQSFLHL